MNTQEPVVNLYILSLYHSVLAPDITAKKRLKIRL